MTDNILDGRKISAEILVEVKTEVDDFKKNSGITPTLATVLVGDDAASKVYVRKKNKTCAELEMDSRHMHLPEDTTAEKVASVLEELNDDVEVNGILLQLPLPKGLPEEKLLDLIHSKKDVDGFHPINMGCLFLGRPQMVPCTPAGIMEMLIRYNIDIKGQRAVIVGRSNIVGKPVAMLLLQQHATVTLCHSRTRDLPSVCQEADILIAAVGRPGMITGDYVREDAVVVDVGINRVESREEVRRIVGEGTKQWRLMEKKGYALVGDVEWKSVANKTRYITPVPGGVGPLTIAMLMRNTLTACKLQCGS